MKTIYIKEIGFDEFYKVSYSIRKIKQGLPHRPPGGSHRNFTE